MKYLTVFIDAIPRQGVSPIVIVVDIRRCLLSFAQQYGECITDIPINYKQSYHGIFKTGATVLREAVCRQGECEVCTCCVESYEHAETHVDCSRKGGGVAC